MSKLRMERRRKVMTFNPVYDQDAEEFLGYLGDLTLKGALLISEEPIKTDQTLNLGIEFRKTSERRAARMAISARVAWCKLEDRRTYYNSGLEFQDLTEKNRKAIERRLKNYEVSHKLPAKKAAENSAKTT